MSDEEDPLRALLITHYSSRITLEMITPEVIATHNLSPEEFNRIKASLGREPNLVELGVFSVMWSEHCSYKSSRIHLQRLPTKGERVIVPPGENAGVVDVGDGWCAAFKIESHNHPASSNLFREPPRASVESCVTSSRWARVQLPRSIVCVSDRSTIRRMAGEIGRSSPVWSPVSRITETHSECRRLAVKSPSTTLTR